MRHTGLDRRKRLMIDSPHRLNNWQEISRERSKVQSANSGYTRDPWLLQVVVWLSILGLGILMMYVVASNVK